MALCCIITGKCDLATRSRQAATLKRLPTYSQHTTSGLFFSSTLLKVILGEVKEEWRRQLVGDYLDVNVLCGPGIEARLVGGKPRVVVSVHPN